MRKQIGFIFLIVIFGSSKLSAFTLLSSDPAWSADELTIQVNNTGCPVDLMTYIPAALEVWNVVSTAKLKLSALETSSYTIANAQSFSYPNVAVIGCDSSFSSTDTTVGSGLYDYSSGASYGYVRINSSGGSGDIGNYGSTTIKYILAHEIGHMLNLGHSSDPTALMYYSFSSLADVSLALDDIRGYTYLYPKSEFEGDYFLGCGLIKGASSMGMGSTLVLFLLPFLLGILIRLKASRTTKLS
ncbi:MAG: matrixin family metalloprotease [Bdellovibrionota bacterium]|nr:matrixin family metalloprotease [Bdellovibrionota bacterium]